MLQQVVDLRAEAGDLLRLLEPRPDSDYERVTQFKGYTINDVLRHLHQGDYMANLSVSDPEAFKAWYAKRSERRQKGVSTRDDARLQFGDLAGRKLLDAWTGTLQGLCNHLDVLDPEARLKWAGPDMGVRMFTTARQMEVWAHGQEIFDELGQDREPTDRLKSIAVIGVRTFGWTYVNRKLPVPAVAPHVRLTAPSGEIWEWNPDSTGEQVDGPALDFCQVVTQVRNVADTALRTTGETARHWLSIAQCFAGPPESPPAPGARRRRD